MANDKAVPPSCGSACSAEEAAAFAALYRRHHSGIQRYCRGRLGDNFEAEDVAQETFVRAWKHRPGGIEGDDLYPWLRVVAANLCTDVLRRRSRVQPSPEVDMRRTDVGEQPPYDEADRLLLREALGGLNPRHQAALLMRESEGLSYADIALRTGMSTASVESVLWRARQSLRKRFLALAGSRGTLVIIPIAGAIGTVVRRMRRGVVQTASRATGMVAGSFPDLMSSAVAAPVAVMCGLVAALSGPAGGSGAVAVASPIAVHRSSMAWRTPEAIVRTPMARMIGDGTRTHPSATAVRTIGRGLATPVGVGDLPDPSVGPPSLPPVTVPVPATPSVAPNPPAVPAPVSAAAVASTASRTPEGPRIPARPMSLR